MRGYDNILLATDFSGHSEAAGKKLWILHDILG